MRKKYIDKEKIFIVVCDTNLNLVNDQMRTFFEIDFQLKSQDPQ